MPTATKTQNKVVEEIYDILNFFGNTEIVEAKNGCNLHLIDERELRKKIVHIATRSYQLGELKVLNNEKDDEFDISDYLLKGHL